MPTLQQTFARLASIDGQLTVDDANKALTENGMKLVPISPFNMDFQSEILNLNQVAIDYVIELIAQGQYDAATCFLSLWRDEDIDALQQQFPHAPGELFETVYVRV